MLFVVDFRCSSDMNRFLDIVSGFLKRVFVCWFNGCFNGLCEFGGFSREYGLLDVGLSFLSTLSLYDNSIRMVFVYDVNGFKKYVIGFNNYSVKNVSLDVLGIDFSKELMLGYMVITDSRIVGPCIYNLSNIVYVLQRILGKICDEYKYDIPVPDCELRRFSFKVQDNGYRYYVLYMCRDKQEYEKLYRVVWLIKCLSLPLLGQEAIIKPIWRQNRPRKE